MKKTAALLILTAFSYLYHAKSKDMVNIHEEIWKDVVGYEGTYQISNTGRLKSLTRAIPRQGRTFTKQGIFYKPCPDKDGYLNSQLSLNGSYKRLSIHRIVALAFLPNPENKPFINHINCIVSDNRVENLEWVTPKENTAHAIKLGRMRFGVPPRRIPDIDCEWCGKHFRPIDKKDKVLFTFMSPVSS